MKTGFQILYAFTKQQQFLSGLARVRTIYHGEILDMRFYLLNDFEFFFSSHHKLFNKNNF